MSPLGQEKRFLYCAAKISYIPLHNYQEFLTSIGKTGFFLPLRIKILNLYSSTSSLYQATFNVCVICHLTYRMPLREPNCKRFTVFLLTLSFQQERPLHKPSILRHFIRPEQTMKARDSYRKFIFPERNWSLCSSYLTLWPRFPWIIQPPYSNTAPCLGENMQEALVSICMACYAWRSGQEVFCESKDLKQ